MAKRNITDTKTKALHEDGDLHKVDVYVETEEGNHRLQFTPDDNDGCLTLEHHAIPTLWMEESSGVTRLYLTDEMLKAIVKIRQKAEKLVEQNGYPMK